MNDALPRKSRHGQRWLLVGALIAVMLGLGGGALSGGRRAVADSSTITFDAYTLGTINGQDGWSSTGAFDREVVTSGGGKALRISNAVTSGSFADQTFSKPLTDEAGETAAANGGMSGGTRQTKFESEFTLSSAVPGSWQTGLSMSVSPDRGDGARMSYLRFEDQSDGIHVLFDDYVDAAPFGTFVGDPNGAGSEDNFVETDIATLNRSTSHTVKFSIQFVDGVRNDIVKIYLDGNLEATGTSWEDYFRYLESNPTRTVDSLLFRTGGTAAPATAGFGFLVDDLSLTTSTPPQCTTTCYVDAAGGNDGDTGASLADAKKTIQAAIDQVSPGGDVLVRAGTYNLDEANLRDPNTGGAGLNNFNIFVNKAGITIQGLDGSDNPITTAPQSATPAQAPVISAERSVPTFGTSNIFVQAAGVKIRGLKMDAYQSGVPFGIDKSIEVAGDNVTIEDVAFLPYDVSIYLSDFHFGDGGPGVSTLKSYTVKDNTFDGDGFESAVYVASGAGWSGPVSGRVISGNEFNNLDDALDFAGPTSSIAWLVNPVGTATITGNTFSQIARRHLLVFGDGGPGVGYADPNWCGILASNTFDKGSFLRAGVAPCTPRMWASAPYTNIAGIYSAIQQYGVNKALYGDTLQVLPGTYNENVVINQDGLTIVGAGIGSTILQGTACGGTGIAITGNRSDISIKLLTVTGYTYGMTTDNIGSTVNNILIEDVSASSNCVHGIWYQAGVTNNLTLRRVNASSNGGAGGRGFWIINGVKTNVTVEDGTFNNNALVGIDISDGSVTGLSITGNTVTGNGDSGIGVLGAKGPGANLVFNNVVTNNGRYGIEMKVPTGNSAASGPGSVVVKQNIVSRTIAATDARDHAGVAVFRRSGGVLNASQPSGVVVTGNTVSGFTRKPVGSTGDGFGIVVEGSGEVVTKNLVSGNNVGIQIQAGNTADVQSTPAFDRGNGGPSTAAINRNSITGNTDFELRNVGAGLTDATCNWFGSAGGPTTVSGTFTTTPWLLTSNLNDPCSTTIVVRPSTLNGWTIFDDSGVGGGSGSFVSGPGTPPLGFGSGRLQLTTSAAGWAFGAGMAGTPLGSLTSLSYSTYRSSVDAGNNLAIALQFNVDYDLSDGYTGYQSRLVFEPYQTFPGGVTQGNWQSWNALSGKWWQAAGGSFPARVGGVPVANVCPQASPCTLATLLSAYPNLGIHPTLGAVVLKAGSTWPGFDGNMDKLKIGVNGTDVTYDFEPDCSTDCYVRTDGNDANSGIADTPSGAKLTIQAAVNAVSPGGTVHVGAGTYTENVTIPKSLTLVGDSQTTTIVRPGTSNPNCGGAGGGSLCAGGSNIILVQADNVTIHDIGLNGDNTSLASGNAPIGGADIDARNGIITNHTLGVYQNLVVHHTTIKNIYLRGIYASTGGSFNFHHDTVQNVQADPGSIGMFNFGGAGTFSDNNVSDTNDAIASNHSRGTQALNNVVTNSGSGVHTDNAGDGGGVADLIKDNNVSNSTYGVWVFVPYIAPTLQSNTVTNVDVGLAAFGQGAAVTTSFINNIVDGQNKPGSTGAYVTTDQLGFSFANSSASFTGNRVVNNADGFYFDASLGGTVSVAASLNCIAGNTNSGMTAAPSVAAINAENNWWGKVDGADPPGHGDKIVPPATIDAVPFLVAPVAGCPVPTDGDGDTIPDTFDNCPVNYNPDQLNSDALAIDNGPTIAGNDGTVANGDGLGDVCDPDDDNDGLLDVNEYSATACGAFDLSLTTHPAPVRGDRSNDDNGNGNAAPPMGTDAADNGPSWDTDNDAQLDGYECTHGTNPRDAASKGPAPGLPGVDTDGDGIPDTWETRGWGTQANLVDSDGDGAGDCREVADVDGNGSVNSSGDLVRYAVVMFQFSGRTMDFDLDKNGVINSSGDLVREAQWAFSVIPCL